MHHGPHHRRTSPTALGDFRHPRRAMLIEGALSLGELLRRPLAAHGVRVVAESRDARSAPPLASARRPDLIVVAIDDTAPPADIRMLREAAPAAAMVAIVASADVAPARALLRAGTDAVVLERTIEAQLSLALETVARGRRYLDPEIGADLAIARPPIGPCGGLTSRQAEIVRLLALGYTNLEIARLLYLSVRTVEAHRARIQERLGLATRAGLVRFALRNGLFDDDALPEPTAAAAPAMR